MLTVCMAACHVLGGFAASSRPARPRIYTPSPQHSPRNGFEVQRHQVRRLEGAFCRLSFDNKEALQHFCASIGSAAASRARPLIRVRSGKQAADASSISTSPLRSNEHSI